MGKYSKTIKKKHHNKNNKEEKRVLTPEEIEQIELKKQEELKRKEEHKLKCAKEANAKKRKEFWDKIICAAPLALCILLLLSTFINTTLVLVKQNNFAKYDDYSEYALKYESSIFRKNGTYYVYFYSDTCSHCKEIKKTVFTYIEENNENGDMPTLYLYKVKGTENFISTESSNLVGVSKHEDLKLVGTPTLILISDGKVSSAYESSEDIKNLLD